MSNMNMDTLNQIRESLIDTYINDEHGNSIAKEYGFNNAQLKIIDEMIIQALRLYHFYVTGEPILETDSPKES